MKKWRAAKVRIEFQPGILSKFNKKTNKVEPFTMSWEPVAVEGDVGVARVEVAYDGPPALVYRDLWIVILDADGCCRSFEEWPFFPGQPLSAADAG